jgi:hypothetical protein
MNEIFTFINNESLTNQNIYKYYTNKIYGFSYDARLYTDHEEFEYKNNKVKISYDGKCHFPSKKELMKIVINDKIEMINYRFGYKILCFVGYKFYGIWNLRNMKFHEFPFNDFSFNEIRELLVHDEIGNYIDSEIIELCKFYCDNIDRLVYVLDNFPIVKTCDDVSNFFDKVEK